jgi:glucose-1-phosphate adenylyltransferase
VGGEWQLPLTYTPFLTHHGALIMRNVLGLILGGGRGPQLYPLTKHRSKAAVPLAGKYRYIDIPISNCLASGLNRIFILTQFQSVSLHRHIANTYKFDAFSHGFVEVLAAQVTNETAEWYRGTADAIRQNIRYLQEEGAREILILFDDQFYRFDFGRLLQAHRDQGAQVTMAVVPVSRSRACSLGIVKPDESSRAIAFLEKPDSDEQLDALQVPAEWLSNKGHWPGARGQAPLSATQDPCFLGSMGIFLFNTEALFDILNMKPLGDDFSHEIFPRILESHRIYTYLFQGYWEHLDTIGSYHAANLALASDDPPFDFHSADGIIYTRMRNLPASRIEGAQLTQSLISDGCIVGAGSRLERCVLGVRSRVGQNVTLRDAVIMGANDFETEQAKESARKSGLPILGIGNDSLLERVIVDKNCRIGRNVRIVNRRRVQEDDGDNYVIREGIVVIPNEAVVPDGTEI